MRERTGQLQWSKRTAGEAINAPLAVLGRLPGPACTHPELSSGGCRLAWPAAGRMQEWVGRAAALLPPKAQRCCKAAATVAAAGADVRCRRLKALASMDHVLLGLLSGQLVHPGEFQGSKLGGEPQPGRSRSPGFGGGCKVLLCALAVLTRHSGCLPKPLKAAPCCALLCHVSSAFVGARLSPVTLCAPHCRIAPNTIWSCDGGV